MRNEGWRFFSRVTTSVALGRDTTKYKDTLDAFKRHKAAAWIPEMIGYSVLHLSTAEEHGLHDHFLPDGRQRSKLGR